MNPLPSQPSGGRSTTVVVGGGGGGVGGVGYHTHPAEAIASGTLDDDRLPARLSNFGEDIADADLEVESGWWSAGTLAANMPYSSSWSGQTIRFADVALGAFGVQMAYEVVGQYRVFRRTLAIFWTAWVEVTTWAKPRVKAAATGNLTLTAPGATIDGVTMASGDRFLAPFQTTASACGIYVWNGASSTATRAVDADASSDLAGAEVAVEQGTVNGGTRWSTSFKSTDTLGTTAQVWFPAEGVTVAYTPTFANVTVGNGTITAAWSRTGNLIFVRARLLFGSTTSVTGNVTVTLPTGYTSAAVPQIITCMIGSSGGATPLGGVGHIGSSATVIQPFHTTSTSVTTLVQLGSVALTLGTNSYILLEGTLEVV